MTDDLDDRTDAEIQGTAPVAAGPETDPTLTWAEDWRPEARTYLQRLAGHLEKREVGERSVTVPIGKAKLLVVAEEVELVKLLASGHEPEDRLSQLLLDSVGVRVKLLATVKSIDMAVAPEEREAARDTLNTDFVHVKDLSAELHAMVSQLSKEGDLEAAIVVAEHRRRLIAIGDLAERVVPGATAQGTVLPPLVTTSAPPEHDAKAAAAARARHLAALGKKRGRARAHAMKAATAVKLGLVAVGLGSLFGLGVIYFQTRQPSLAQLSVADLSAVPGVVQVVPRPPGILVIVSDEVWNRIGAQDRQKAMKSVVATVRAAGYTSAEIRSPTRQGLGQWSAGHTVEVAP